MTFKRFPWRVPHLKVEQLDRTLGMTSPFAAISDDLATDPPGGV